MRNMISDKKRLSGTERKVKRKLFEAISSVNLFR